MDKPERPLLHQLGRTSRAMYAAFEAEVGQPLPRWRILQALRDHACASQRQLAALIIMDPGALTRLLKALEADGLVKRISDPQDNRQTLVSLTPAGTRLIDEAQSTRRAFARKALRHLPERDLEITMAVLEALEARFRAMKSP